MYMYVHMISSLYLCDVFDTGLPSWGIAWYVDGVLIPELHLQRGITYTFRVAGGWDNSTQSKYHPFYITDSVDGGYEQVYYVFISNLISIEVNR